MLLNRGLSKSYILGHPLSLNVEAVGKVLKWTCAKFVLEVIQIDVNH